MSDNPEEPQNVEHKPSQVPHPQAEQVASAQELAAQGNTWARPHLQDSISEMKAHCVKVIDTLGIPAEARAHALTKLEEMTFWLRTAQK
jgi:hypothetical protein